MQSHPGLLKINLKKSFFGVFGFLRQGFNHVFEHICQSLGAGTPGERGVQREAVSWNSVDDRASVFMKHTLHVNEMSQDKMQPSSSLSELT